ncbi:MAG: hypothetical protein PHR51_00300 [Patescibacteria group bacterium]|nr:hypothetical protein [Patescibacteria group bacterium]
MKYLVWTTIGVIAAVVLLWFGLRNHTAATETDSEVMVLAQWLTDSGAKLYGSFWCSACNYQKELFGKAANELPYVECSSPDKTAQTQPCLTAHILRYPTWEFSDGSRHEGVLTLEQLKQLTGYQAQLVGPTT